MQQKLTWTHYLVFGISLCFLLSLSGCSEKASELKLDVDLIYVNETNYSIQYYELVNNQQRLLFELAPSSQKKVEIRTSGGSDNLTLVNCCNGVLGDYQGENSILISYNNNRCLTYTNGQGSTTGNITSYESRVISNRYYEFLYRFTEAEYNLATNCN